ncbi:LIAS isoform 22 [Pan troglodytes]|uniref:LIAS isoform 22 n=1 Tax=Pan troglodytes TaxID=9598 RepID=A0A2J8PGW9_PANTR|nr:LIAS isoform 22 [Pan troglodytes]
MSLRCGDAARNLGPRVSGRANGFGRGVGGSYPFRAPMPNNKGIWEIFLQPSQTIKLLAR